jgi:hypothetical protein
MFKSKKQPQSIDFLQPVYSPTDAWSTAYTWLINIGKYLLIGVEIIVLGVFFSRFILDKQNNDLTDDLNAKVTLLSNDTWKKNSITYGNYQTLLGDIKITSKGQEVNSTPISELISGVPTSLHLVSFSYAVGNVTLRFTATNLSAVQDYESALKSNPAYSDVKFSISKDNDTLNVSVNFSIVNS